MDDLLPQSEDRSREQRASLPAGFSLLLGFEDPALEREYVAQARARRAQILKYMLGLAIAGVLAYLVLNPAVLPSKIGYQFNIAATTLLITLVVYFFLLRSDYFYRKPAIDFIMFAIISVCMGEIALILGQTSTITGWPRAAVLASNTKLLVSFSILAFVASTRWYLLWMLFESSLYAYCITRGETNASLVGIAALIPAMAVALLTNFSLDWLDRTGFIASRQLTEERAHTERLLFNVLPQSAAERLKAGQIVADAFSEATVVFVDLVGSADFARFLSPGHFLTVLNRVFGLADKAAANCGLEKVKTIGDAYLAIAGTSTPGRASDAVCFAEEVLREIKVLAQELKLDLQVRIGLHTGPVIGGIIGDVRMAYDYWGDTMNVASRIQAAAPIGGATVSKQTYYATRAEHEYMPQRIELLKGIGETELYDLKTER